MENYNYADALEDGPALDRGFSKSQLLKFSTKDIEKWDLREHAQALGSNEDNPNKSLPNQNEPNEEGPRPPKEEDFPDEEKEELLSEVSDPDKKD
ncbi:MAG TPA: hypothetical protein VK014_13750 [Cyclobacteriaceae bacterium]|nr:hypothetical protein [Cyclobacteriaceae bacterium]